MLVSVGLGVGGQRISYSSYEYKKKKKERKKERKDPHVII